MNQRNLANIDTDGIGGYPVSPTTPQNGQVIAFLNGEWVYVNVATGSDITSTASVGSGEPITYSVFDGIAYFRSIGGSTNISVSNNGTTISAALNSNLTGIASIANTGGTTINSIITTELREPTNLPINIYTGLRFSPTYPDDGWFTITNSDPYWDFNISDGGLFEPKALRFRTSLNNIDSDLLVLNNSNDIIFPIVNAGTAVKRLGLNATNRLIYDNTVDDTTAANIGGGEFGAQGLFKEKVGSELRFKSLSMNNDANIYLNDIGDAIEIDLQPSLINITSINGIGQMLEIRSDLISFPYIGSVNGSAIGNMLCIDIGGNLRNTNDLDKIQNINQYSPIPQLQIHSYDIKLNNVQDIALSTKRNLFIDNDNIIHYGYSCNSATNAAGAVNSLIFADNISLNGELQLRGISAGTGGAVSLAAGNVAIGTSATQNHITSLGAAGMTIQSNTLYAPNLPVESVVQYDLTVAPDGRIVKSPIGTTGSKNIYNTSDTIIDATRTLSGLSNPVSGIEYKLQLEYLNLCFINNVAYSPLNTVLTGGNDWILSGDPNYTRAIWAPYSYFSQKADVIVFAAFGSYTQFATYRLDLFGTTNYFFEIDIYENNNNNDCFNAKYTLCANLNNLIVGSAKTVLPDRASLCTNGTLKNYMNLEVKLDTNSRLHFILKQASRTGFASVYNVFIKYKGKNDITYLDSNITGVANLEQSAISSRMNYVYSFQGNSGLTSLIFNYTDYGKNLKFTMYGGLNSLADNTSCDISAYLNGSLVAVGKVYSRWKNQNVFYSIFVVLDWLTLVNTNILYLNAVNALTFVKNGVDPAQFDFGINFWRYTLEFI